MFVTSMHLATITEQIRFIWAPLGSSIGEWLLFGFSRNNKNNKSDIAYCPPSSLVPKLPCQLEKWYLCLPLSYGIILVHYLLCSSVRVLCSESITHPLSGMLGPHLFSPSHSNGGRWCQSCTITAGDQPALIAYIGVYCIACSSGHAG